MSRLGGKHAAEDDDNYIRSRVGAVYMCVCVGGGGERRAK